MDEKELKALVSLLDDEDQEVIVHVEQKIKSLGNQIIPFLEEEWESSFNPVVQRKIEDLIHNLQFNLLDERIRKWKETGSEDLLKGMWLASSYLYPDLKYESLREEIEQLYYEVWLQFKTDLQPFDQIKILNSIFFGKLGFRANTQNFHAPANSMINNVLESKKGNPISLCVVYLLIAQKLKMPIYGVNLPNLFILTYKNSDLQFYINAFNKGLIFSRPDIDNYIAQLNLKAVPAYYEPCTHLDIIQRVFRNLIVSFQKIGDTEKVNDVQRLLGILEGD